MFMFKFDIYGLVLNFKLENNLDFSEIDFKF